MSAIQAYERKYQEWLRWYGYHRRQAEVNRDIMQRMAFLEKTVKGLMELQALAVDAVKQANNNGGYNGLYLPSKLLLRSDEIRNG